MGNPQAGGDTVAPTAHPARRRRSIPLTAFFGAWAVLFALMTAWVFATPPSASPDEPAHIVRAASVVRGELVGTPSQSGHIVTVPRYIAESHAVTCFAFNPAVTANCAFTPSADPWQSVEAPTTAGLYNPLYYAVVGLPSLVFHDAGGIYAMRILSALLTTLFAALAFANVFTMRNRRMPLLAFAVAVTPMLLFLGGSVNPSAVEATATLAVFCGMLAITLSPDPARLTGRAVVVMAGAVVAVNSRGLSPLWVALALVIPLLLLTDRDALVALLKRRSVIVLIAVVAAGTIAAGLWTVGTNSLANAIEHPDQALSFPGIGSSPLVGFQKVFIGTIGYSQGLVGLFGWLDTPAPDVVLYLWGLAIGVIAVGAVVVLRRRRLLVAWLLVAAFLLCPALVQAAYIHGGGMIWQGRYNLPLFLCLIVGLAALLGDTAFVRASYAWRRIAVIVVVGAAGAQFWAFEATLRRYAVGSNGSMRTYLFGQPAWAPPGGVWLWLAVFSVLLVAAAALLLHVSAWSRQSEEVVDAVAASPALGEEQPRRQDEALQQPEAQQEPQPSLTPAGTGL